MEGYMPNEKQGEITRRDFVAKSTTALAGFSILTNPFAAKKEINTDTLKVGLLAPEIE